MSTVPSCRVMAYQVVPQITAQMTTPPMPSRVVRERGGRATGGTISGEVTHGKWRMALGDASRDLSRVAQAGLMASESRRQPRSLSPARTSAGTAR